MERVESAGRDFAVQRPTGPRAPSGFPRPSSGGSCLEARYIHKPAELFISVRRHAIGGMLAPFLIQVLDTRLPKLHAIGGMLAPLLTHKGQDSMPLAKCLLCP